MNTIKLILQSLLVFCLFLLSALNLSIFHFNQTPRLIQNQINHLTDIAIEGKRIKLIFNEREIGFVANGFKWPERLTAKKLSFTLDWRLSLATWSPRLQKLHIDTPQIYLKTEKTTDISIGDIRDQLMDYGEKSLLPDTDIQISHGTVLLLKPGKTEAFLDNLYLNFNVTQKHSSSRFKFSQYTKSSVNAEFEWLESIGNDAELSVDATSVPLPIINQFYDSKQLLFSSGSADVKGVFQTSKGKINGSSATVNFKNLALIRQASNDQLTIPNFSANLNVEEKNDFRLYHFQTKLPTIQKYQGFTLSATLSHQTKSKALSLFVPQFNLRNIHYILPFVSSKTLKTHIRNMQAFGFLKNVRLSTAKDKGTSLKGEFKNIQIAMPDNSLHIKHLSGSLDMNKTFGRLKLKSPNLYVRSKFFPRPFDLGQFSGILELARPQKKLWKLNAKDIQINSSWLRGGFQLGLDVIPNQPLPKINFMGDLAYLNLNKIYRLIPNMASKNLKSWLGAAFSTGYIKHGKLSFIGDLNKYPFQSHKTGRLLAILPLKQTQVSFDPNWYPVKEIDGVVTIDQQNLKIAVNHAEMGQAIIKKVEADIDNLISDVPTLAIHSKIEANLVDAIDVLLHSPIKDSVGQTLDDLGLNGESSVDLSLFIPIHPKKPIKVKGAVHVTKAQMYIRAADLPIKKLTGKINFSDKKVSATNLEGEVFGGMIQTQIRTPIGFNRSNSHMQIKIKGHGFGKSLSDWVTFPLPSIKGRVDINALLDIIPNASSRMKLDLQFDKATVSIPDLLDKKPKRALKAAVDLQWKDEKMQVRFLVPEVGLQGLIRKKNDAWVGGIAMGNIPLSVSDALLLIEFKHRQFTLDHWQNWFERQKKANNKNSKQKVHLHLNTNEFKFGSSSYHDMQINVYNHLSGWLIDIKNPIMAGEITIPTDKPKPIVATFSRYVLGSKDNKTKPDTRLIADKSDKSIDPEDFISQPVHFSVQSLMFGEQKIGQLSLRLEPNNQEVAIDAVVLNNKNYRLFGNGRWDPKSKKTNLNLTLNANRIEDLLRKFSYTGTIKGAKTNAKINLNWRGDPEQFSLETLNGNIEINIEKGVLSDIDAGSGKVFALMGLHNLGKRITLNLGDIATKGLLFDKITGKFKIRNGIAETNDTVLVGNSVRVYFEGAANFDNQAMNFKARVHPRLSSTLPVVGGVTSGPVGALTGVVLMIYNTITNGAFDKNIAQNYHLSGTWKEPRVVQE